MKKTLLTTVICTLMAAAAAFGQTQSLSFNDNSGTANAGSYNPSDVFTVDIFLTWDPYMASGYSLWLEVENALAPNITITNATYFTFTNATDNGYPKAFNSASGASSGFMTDDDTVINPQSGTIDEGDLGATSPINSAGTYKVLTLEFTLAGAAPGTYQMFSTTASPKVSIVTSTDGSGNFADNPLAAQLYTITIVPEPSTLALIGLTAVAGAVIARRRRALRG